MNVESCVKLALLALLALSCSSTPPAPETELKPEPLVKEVPANIKKEVQERIDAYWIRLEKIEKEVVEVISKITDPEVRFDKINEARDQVSECAEGIYDVLHDNNYWPYRSDQRYWGAHEKRLVYLQSVLNDLKKKADQAFNEVKAKKEKESVK